MKRIKERKHGLQIGPHERALIEYLGWTIEDNSHTAEHESGITLHVEQVILDDGRADAAYVLRKPDALDDLGLEAVIPSTSTPTPYQAERILTIVESGVAKRFGWDRKLWFPIYERGDGKILPV